jgi:hypothetical protein
LSARSGGSGTPNVDHTRSVIVLSRLIERPRT